MSWVTTVLMIWAAVWVYSVERRMHMQKQINHEQNGINLDTLKWREAIAKWQQDIHNVQRTTMRRIQELMAALTVKLRGGSDGDEEV